MGKQEDIEKFATSMAEAISVVAVAEASTFNVEVIQPEFQEPA